MNLRCILFDLDGTLANTLPLCIQAFRESLEPILHRSVSDDEIVATFGPSEEATIRAFLPNDPEGGMERFLTRYRRIHSQWPGPFAGIREILEVLQNRGIIIGLVTSKGRKTTDFTLSEYGLTSYFRVIYTGVPHGPIKDRQIGEAICHYGLPYGEVLYVGDSPIDILASRSNRIKVAAAAWAPTTDVPKLRSMNPDYLFTSVADFAQFLEQTPSPVGSHPSS